MGKSDSFNDRHVIGPVSIYHVTDVRWPNVIGLYLLGLPVKTKQKKNMKPKWKSIENKIRDYLDHVDTINIGET